VDQMAGVKGGGIKWRTHLSVYAGTRLPLYCRPHPCASLNVGAKSMGASCTASREARSGAACALSTVAVERRGAWLLAGAFGEAGGICGAARALWGGHQAGAAGSEAWAMAPGTAERACMPGSTAPVAISRDSSSARSKGAQSRAAAQAAAARQAAKLSGGHPGGACGGVLPRGMGARPPSYPAAHHLRPPPAAARKAAASGLPASMPRAGCRADA